MQQVAGTQNSSVLFAEDPEEGIQRELTQEEMV